MNMYNPVRQENESFEDYKMRRELANRMAKSMQQGWRPTRFVQHQPNLDKKFQEQK